MQIIRGANLAVAFLLELALLLAVGYWGFVTGSALPLKLLLGIGGPVVIAVIWGIFMAPRAARPLHEPWHLLAQVILFGLGIAVLYAAGQPVWAALFAIVFVINIILIYAFKQETDTAA